MIVTVVGRHVLFQMQMCCVKPSKGVMSINDMWALSDEV